MALDGGEYEYPWKSTFEEPTAEALFGKMVSERLNEQSRVLDAGCGHGGFLTRWASHAKEAVGVDIQSLFIETAVRRMKSDSFRFLTVDPDIQLSFADGYFDMVYSKKGPWLFKKAEDEGFRILKSGGHVLQMIHIFTDGGLRT